MTGSRDGRRLRDIADSIAKVQRWTAESREGDMYRSAVFRELAVIGEAANHLSDQFKADHPEIPWPRIVGLRNALVHEYWDTHWPLIEAVVRESLPTLLSAVID